MQSGGKRLPDVYKKEHSAWIPQATETKTTDFDPETIEF
jgi:hypothetical protein